MPIKNRIVVIGAPKNVPDANRLAGQLSPLAREFSADLWSSGEAGADRDPSQAMLKQLKTATTILLIVTVQLAEDRRMDAVVDLAAARHEMFQSDLVLIRIDATVLTRVSAMRPAPKAFSYARAVEELTAHMRAHR